MTPNIQQASALGGDCFSYIVAGPPGTGKSTLLGDMATVQPLLLIATLAREAQSWKYRQHNVDVIVLEDLQWSPGSDGHQGSFIANAFNEFKQLMEWLRADTKYGAVALDSGTEFGEQAWHESLKPHGVASPAYMEDKKSRWLPYETISNLMDPAIKQLTSLTTTAARPKYVGISWHVQPPKEDTVEVSGSGPNATRTEKESKDHAGEGVEYEGKVLPMLRGGYRRKLTSQVNAVVYTDIQMVVTNTQGLSQASRGMDVKYVLQVRSDQEKHCKIPGPPPTVKFIPNNFAEFSKLVQTGQVQQAAIEATQAVEAPASASRSSLRRK